DERHLDECSNVMSDIPPPSNGPAAAERPPVRNERPRRHAPVGRSKRVFGRMAVAVILIFWTAQFTTVTISRLVRMPEESLAYIEPRAVVTACAILLSFGILAVLRAVRGWTLLKRALIAAGLAVVGCCIHTLVNMGV